MLRLLICLFLITLNIYASDIAIVKKTQGEVYAIRDSAMVKLKVGDKLQVGDTIITKEKSGIGVIFHDGSILSLGDNSIMAIEDYLFNPAQHEFKFNVDFKKGFASFESGKIGDLSPESVEFKVPEGIVGIRGTKFYVEVK
jgi:hypothetical protein